MSFKKSQQGFSLLELMVVIAIFLIITAVVMTNIPSFGRRGALDLTAQEVAGCIRAAQTYGTSAKANEYSEIKPVGALLDEQDNKITIFFDNDETNTFDDSSDKVIETCDLKGYSFVLSGAGEEGDNGLDKVSVIYTPTSYQADTMSTLEPVFYNNAGDGDTPLDTSRNFVEINIKSLRNEEHRCVYIYASGQITVGDCS